MSNEPTIAEMNIIIARFMVMEGSDNFISLNYMYEQSWDLLMPVVKKARSLSINFESPTMLVARYKAVENELRNINLINTHYCLYKLIEWYNKQQAPVISKEDAGKLLNLPADKEPHGMPMPAIDPFNNKQQSNEQTIKRN